MNQHKIQTNEHTTDQSFGPLSYISLMLCHVTLFESASRAPITYLSVSTEVLVVSSMPSIL